MNPVDEQAIRQQLHAELGSLEVQPAPVIAVTGRGKAIRARRRALAAGLAAVVAAGLLAGRFIGAPGPTPGTVTVNPPNPRAPGGVFASGTADKKPWRLAVRNIAADPGTRWCQPAVMFNGRDGDVLFKNGPGVQSFGNPAFLSHIPGFPGVGAVFTQVTPDVTRLVTSFPGGRQLAVRPVWVRACGQRFHLAGFAFPMREAGISTLTTYAVGFVEGLNIDFRTAAMNVPDGIWVDWDMSSADLAASRAATTIGSGRTGFARWTVKESLGLSGQCYATSAREPLNAGREHECGPVSLPPFAASLVPLPFPGQVGGGLNGYAGLVNPRARALVVSINNGTTDTVHPVNVAGRAYVAFVVPPGCQITQLTLRFAHHTTTINVTSPAN